MAKRQQLSILPWTKDLHNTNAAGRARAKAATTTNLIKRELGPQKKRAVAPHIQSNMSKSITIIFAAIFQ
jgi:hypothetical protein